MTFGVVASSHPLPPSTFSPSDVTGLVGWWDATTIAGLSDLDRVATWSDLSASGYDFEQGTLGNRPFYRTSGINSKPALEFNAGSVLNMQILDTGALNLTGDFLIVAAVQFKTVNRGATSQNTVISKNFTGYEFFEYQTTAKSYVGGTSNSPTSAASTLAATTPYVYAMRRTSTNSLTLRINGSSVASATNSASGSGVVNPHLGARPGGTGNLALDGLVGEICVWDQDVSSSDLDDIETYFTGKWT